MSDAKSPQDLSMDEILATIRRIIAEDERSSGAAGRGSTARSPTAGVSAAAPADEGAGSGPGDLVRDQSYAPAATDVLDLTDALDDAGEARRPTSAATPPGDAEAQTATSQRSTGANFTAPTPAAAKPAGTSLGTDPPSAAEALPRAEPAASPSAASAQPAGANDEQLVSDVAALAAATAFGRLAAVPRVRPEPPLVGGRPLEEMVCDLLRPLLRTWLDENLPGIVERLVQAEIARISVRSGRD
jgi:cell pole-organizing protein PopZ